MITWELSSHSLKIPYDAYIDSQPNSDRLFITQSRVRYADWSIVDYDEKATLLVNKPYSLLPLL